MSKELMLDEATTAAVSATCTRLYLLHRQVARQSLLDPLAVIVPLDWLPGLEITPGETLLGWPCHRAPVDDVGLLYPAPKMPEEG